MGLVVTARQMIDAARRITKTETLDEANSFCTDAELLEVLNGELAELEDTILEVQDDEYSSASQSITLVPGTSLYPLGAAAYKVRSVDVTWSSNVKRSAHRFMEADRNRFATTQPSWTQFGRVYFRVIGSNIEIIPTPLTAVSVTVNYTPSFTPLTAYTGAGGTYESNNGWHMAAVWGLAGYISQADANEEKAGLCYAQKERQLARVRAMAGTRVTGEPPTIQRIRNRDPWED